MPPVEDPEQYFSRFHSYQLSKSGVNCLLALGRGPEDEAFAPDIGGGAFLLYSSAVGEDKGAVLHKDQEIPVADRVYYFDVLRAGEAFPEPEAAGVLDGARVEGEKDGSWGVFEDLDEVGKDLGVVHVLGAVDGGEGVRILREVQIVHYAALFKSLGHVPEAGVDDGVAGDVDLAVDMLVPEDAGVVAGGREQDFREKITVVY